MVNLITIVDKLKKFKGLKSDTAVAEILNLNQSAFAERKRRNSIPYIEIINFCDSEGVSLDWLLLDRGTPKGIQATATPYRSEILKQIVRKVDTFLNDESIEVDTDKKAQVIAMIYEDLVNEKTTEGELTENIRRLVGLAASTRARKTRS